MHKLEGTGFSVPKMTFEETSEKNPLISVCCAKRDVPYEVQFIA